VSALRFALIHVETTAFAQLWADHRAATVQADEHGHTVTGSRW